MSTTDDSKARTARLRRTRLLGHTALFLGTALAVFWGVQRGRALRADAPPAATLVSPDGATVTVGKPFFVWDEEAPSAERRNREELA
jgi:hypothetical protein